MFSQYQHDIGSAPNVVKDEGQSHVDTPNDTAQASLLEAESHFEQMTQDTTASLETNPHRLEDEIMMQMRPPMCIA